MVYRRLRMSRIFYCTVRTYRPSTSLDTLTALVFAFLLLTPTAFAQSGNGPDIPPEVRGVKIVVPMARGKSAWGAKHVTKALRTFIDAGTGAMISSKALSRAQQKLGHRGSKKYREKNLALAGRKAGADYVLLVRVSKKGWAYTAHAILINTANGRTDMDFRSGYFKPKVEGPDRGTRIGKTTLGKIAKLIQDEQGPARLLAQKTDDNPLNERIRETSVAPSRPPESASQPEEKPEPEAIAKSTASADAKNDPLSERLEDTISTTADVVSNKNELEERLDEPSDQPRERPVETSQARLADNIDDVERAAEALGAADADLSADVSNKPGTESGALIHFRVGAGSNFAHNYKLSSKSIENSGVSYPLSAMSLFSSHLQLNIPGLGLGVLADIAFVPVRLRISINNKEEAAPNASLLDVRVGVNYLLALTDEGASGMRIVPGLGARITQFNVDNHAGPIVLSNSALSPILFADFWYPVLASVDVKIGLEGGYVASFEESPQQSGSGGSKQGFNTGGVFGLYLWLSDMLAVTVHVQSLYQQVQLSGTPNRQLPPGEAEQLVDPTVSIFDARGSLGVELRI
jgi:hypothetical protein